MMKFIRYKIYIPIKNFFLNIRDTFYWLPLVWNDRDWDYCFMLEMERKKLKKVLRWYEDNEFGMSAYGWHDYRTMRWALSCLDIILDNDWWRINFPEGSNWLKIRDHEKYYEVDPYVNLRNWKRFLPYFNEENLNKTPKLWSVELREEKAWHLYHRLREQYMRNWWD